MTQKAEFKPPSSHTHASKKANPAAMNSPYAIDDLHHLIGNQAVQRLLAPQVQRKKVINEDLVVEGELSVKNMGWFGKGVIAYDTLAAIGDTHTNNLRVREDAEIVGNANVGGKVRENVPQKKAEDL
jgi:hypothetical protein